MVVESAAHPSEKYAVPERFLIRPGPGIASGHDGRCYTRQRNPFDIKGRNAQTTLITLARATAILREPSRFRSGRTPLWWIGAGTALGFARDKGFIFGDSDIDIRIGLEFRGNAQASKAVLAILNVFESAGFRLMCEVHWDGRPMQAALFDTRNRDVILDLYFFYSGVSEQSYVNATPLGYRRKPAHLLERLQPVGWPGAPEILVNVPTPIEPYLEWRYGPEWHIRKTKEQMGPRDNACFRPLPRATVLTYGTWDLFHHGHQRLLERASAMGDQLIVGVVADEICRQRGKQPAENEQVRADRLRSFPGIDDVFIKREPDSKQFDIERFGAKYLVIGDDWKGHPRYANIDGYRGVEVRYLERTPDISSTQLRMRLAAEGSPNIG